MSLRKLGGSLPPNRPVAILYNAYSKRVGRKTVGHFTFPIVKNTLLVIPKRVIHSSKYWSLDCSGYVVMFNIDFLFKTMPFPGS